MALHLDYHYTDEDISDEQIDQLLKRAEVRLREQANSQDRPNQSISLPRTSRSELPAPYVQTRDQIAQVDPKRLLSENDRWLANSVKKVEDPLEVKRKKYEEKKASAGFPWFNLPRTNLTPEFKRELQLLRMRDVLDPKRHYKKESSSAAVPEFSQVGTVIEGPTEFYSARIPNSQRKRTLVEEVLEGERETGRFKSKYNEVQAKKMSGKKSHYKRLMEKRYGRKMKR